jgi:hypothetical protein
MEGKKNRKLVSASDAYLCTMFLISYMLSIYLLRHMLDNIFIETIIYGCISIHWIIHVVHYTCCIYYAFVSNIIIVNNY